MQNKAAADRTIENRQAEQAAADPSAREAFLAQNQNRILKLAARLSGRNLTVSDDEWIISMMAVSQALDSYAADKGDFWPFAAVVVKSRLMDWFRSTARSSSEISVAPEVFSGEVNEEEESAGLSLAVQDKISVVEDTSLRDEIEALQQELEPYGISFFDLAGSSPKARKTRSECAGIVAAMFLPPPLLAALRKLKKLPAKEILSRKKCSRKTLEKYRGYLITASLMLDGDYPGLCEYISYMKEAVAESKSAADDTVHKTERERRRQG